ncbi:hypothetical protein [Hymenobacter sp.]|jgi:hypothetical protein|uniref:hypothetical protein n=1 Tax=Hymenobacter sp. TaxID=1898978 RepID=UPI002ED9B395
MSIELLLEASAVSIFYDNQNRWLYLDWCGDLTLSSVQESCLQIASCFLSRNCTRILNDNTNVTSITPDVGSWLASEYLPHVQLAGVEYVAWVYSSGVEVQCCADIALFNVTSPVVAMFGDVASAYSWLSAVKFKSPVMMKPPVNLVYRNQQELKNHVASLSNVYLHQVSDMGRAMSSSVVSHSLLQMF